MDETMDNNFVFIIPSYNNKKWYRRNLNSVINQKYKKWRIIYVDDNSTDATYSLVYKYIKNNGIEEKVTLIKNDRNYRQAYSRYIGYNQCNDDEICVLLDGDDWLYDENVLDILNENYIKYDLNISYGSYVKFSNGKIQDKVYGMTKFPKNIVENNLYRTYKWVSCHLRTCRARLLKTIPEKYLKDYDNNWLKVSTDLAEMLWVLQISDGKHMNISLPLYVYNIDNSISYDTSYYNYKLDKYRSDINKKIRFYYDSDKIYNVHTSINNVFDKVYVLNLAEEKEKFLFTKKRLEKYGIECHRFEAINGSNFIDEFNSNEYKEESNLYRSYGAYGCLKSKIAILEDAIYNHYDRILILEDDILLIENFCEVFQKYYNEIPEDWKVLYFGSSDRNIASTITNQFYSRPTVTSTGTFAFGLDKSVFEELLYNFKMFNFPDDQHLIRLSLKYEDNSYIFNPNLIIADTTTSSTTTLFNYDDIYDIYQKRILKFNWKLYLYDLEFLPDNSKMLDILLNVVHDKKQKKSIANSTSIAIVSIIVVIAIVLFIIYMFTKHKS